MGTAPTIRASLSPIQILDPSTLGNRGLLPYLSHLSQLRGLYLVINLTRARHHTRLHVLFISEMLSLSKDHPQQPRDG
jgi:hypothetical protein